MAKVLSARCGVPLLNLAEVPVSTGTLRALIADLAEGTNLIRPFHHGLMPIIIDALDEGRLLSNETGFESFLNTTAELILSDRSTTDRPKLIVFGRPDSTELARLGLLMEGGITSCSVDVGFFDEASARDLIDAYARQMGGPASAYCQHPQPASEVVDAYFAAIEGALDLPQGDLWQSERGMGFAGYAPILAALGSILAEIENFSDVARRLRDSGAAEAWDVIDLVIGEILDRERGKLCDQLAPKLSVDMPPEAYDRSEQLGLLAWLVHQDNLKVSDRVALPPTDRQKYYALVEQYLPEHPFIRERQFRNPVLGAVVLAHAIIEDVLGGRELDLTEASKLPFLWRSFRSRVLRDGQDGVLVEGIHVGAVLASLWNDPICENSEVVIRSQGDDLLAVHVPRYLNGETVFRATPPLVLGGQVRDCNVDVAEPLILRGYGAHGGGGAAITITGTTTLIANEVQVDADMVILDGEIWLEANEVSSVKRLNLSVRTNARIGLGGEFANCYPWNGVPATLDPPYEEALESPIDEMLAECVRRLSVGRVLTLNTDYTVPEDDSRMRWVQRSFRDLFPRVIRTLIDEGLASDEAINASGSSPKRRVHFDVTWEQLREAVLAREPAKSLVGICERLRKLER